MHNQSALALKLALKLRANTVVVTVPFHLAEDDELLRDEVLAKGIPIDDGATEVVTADDSGTYTAKS
jgi:hypothetical protein